MNIQIKCFATLRDYAPADNRLRIGAETTVATVIKQLGIPEAEVKLIFINGLRKELDDTLTDGDRLGLFPPVGGG